jgi:hydroxyacylglutathione hydrolase
VILQLVGAMVKMKILNDIYLVASGNQGFGISNGYDCSVYLLDGKDDVVLIDSGSGLDQQLMLSNIQAEGINPDRITKILLTHAHADHSGGTFRLVERLHCQVLLHQAEANALELGDEVALALEPARKRGYYPSDYRLSPTHVDIRLEDGNVIQVGKYTLHEYYTPGHSLGSVCYLLVGHERRVLFSGDSFFLGGKINLLNCVGSSLADYREHSRKLSGLDLDALMPGHFGFTLSNAQRHVDQAITALEDLLVPPMAL